MTDRRAAPGATLHHDSVTALHAIYHEHARLAEVLAYASDTARVIRDNGIFDPHRYREVWRFIHDIALPHLRHEEEDLFPQAKSLGIAEEALEFLRRDHEQLRVLARVAEASGLDGKAALLPHDAAEVIERFVRAFDNHSRYEEALFRELERGTREAV